MTTLREKLVKIGAKVVSHDRSVSFQIAELAIPRKLFVAIVERIAALRSPGRNPTRLPRRTTWPETNGRAASL